MDRKFIHSFMSKMKFVFSIPVDLVRIDIIAFEAISYNCFWIICHRCLVFFFVSLGPWRQFQLFIIARTHHTQLTISLFYTFLCVEKFFFMFCLFLFLFKMKDASILCKTSIQCDNGKQKQKKTLKVCYQYSNLTFETFNIHFLENVFFFVSLVN